MVPLFLAAGQWLYLWYTTETIDLLYQKLLDGKVSRVRQDAILNNITSRVTRVATQLRNSSEERRQLFLPYAILNSNQKEIPHPGAWKCFDVIKDHLYRKMDLTEEMREVDRLITDWMHRQPEDWGTSASEKELKLQAARKSMLSAFGRSSPILWLEKLNLTIVPSQVISKIAQLKTLSLTENNIREFPPISLPELTWLSICENRIHEFPTKGLENLPKLEELAIASNHITRVPPGSLRNQPKLKSLDLSSNQIEEVPTLDGKELRSLNLSKNAIKECPPSSLSECIALEVLDLAKNQLKEFPQSLPTSLCCLILSNNPIEQIKSTDLSPLKQLKELFLNSNTLIEAGHSYSGKVERR